MKQATRTSAQRNKKGFTLIEVMMALAVAAIIAIGMAESLSQLYSQLRAISQKQEIIELKNIVTQQIAKPGVCTWQLRDKIIDVSMATTETAPSPTALDLGQLYMGLDATSPLLAKSGQRIPESLAGVKVANVQFKNIYATGNPNEYKGIFQITFDPASLAQPVKPLQVQQIFLTDPVDPTNSKKILVCKGGGGGGTGSIKTECATGIKRGKGVGATLVNHTFTVAPAVGEMFDVFEYPGGEAAWGLSCKSLYVQTSCTGSELNSDTTMGPDLWQLQYGRLGCFSDNEELGGADPTVYLTCCQLTVEP